MAKFTTYKVIQLPTSNIDEDGLYFVKDGDKWKGYLRSNSEWIEDASLKPGDNVSDLTIDINTSDIQEGSNLYFTNERVNSNTNVSANTSARHTHANKALLDTYNQTNGDITSAVSHVNRTDNPHEVTTEQVNVLEQKYGEIDDPGTEYPIGITVFYAEWEGETGAVVTYRSTYGLRDGNISQMFTAYHPLLDRTEFKFRSWNNLMLEWNGWFTIESTEGAQQKVDQHANDTNNPHNVTKAQVGLGNVNNTSDTNKPVSTAQQTAINQAKTDANSYTNSQIGNLSTVASTGDYNDLTGKPTIPDKTSDLTNDSGFVSNSEDTYTQTPKANQIVTLKEDEYDALVTKDINTLYIIIED